MDHRKFLGRKEELVLPHVGGAHVQAPDRRLRLAKPLAEGWWRFEVRGRDATPVGRADAPSLDDRPRVRGHLVGWWLFTSGSEVERLLLPPVEEPLVLSPASGRRWYGGITLFEEIAFETEAEEEARRALEESRALAGIRGLPPSLRAAWAYARLVNAAREAGSTVSPHAVLRALPSVADGSREPWVVLSAVYDRVHEIAPGRRWPARAVFRAEPSIENAGERAAEVLAAADALLLSSRFVGDMQFEVRFTFMGERFIALVDWRTLHVYDAGICLSGADEMLGLDALPSVIREAIENDALNITRR